ncbi:hypothetical protein Ciccas_010561 [Cichlidogyrus casuarinus]|uniref:Dynein heavy chain tail domain-containing protein n=1 Tax=Cichlidogyrus casuarinus TaxID=1844966 RepID=A0ABD2PVF5_9PLAT
MIIEDYTDLPQYLIMRCITMKDNQEIINKFFAGSSVKLYCLDIMQVTEKTAEQRRKPTTIERLIICSKLEVQTSHPYICFYNFTGQPINDNIHESVHVFYNSFRSTPSACLNFELFDETLLQSVQEEDAFLQSATVAERNDYLLLIDQFLRDHAFSIKFGMCKFELPDWESFGVSYSKDINQVLKTCGSRQKAKAIVVDLEKTVCGWISLIDHTINYYERMRVDKGMDAESEFSFWSQKLNHFLKLSLQLDRGAICDITKFLLRVNSSTMPALNESVDKIYASIVEAKSVIGFHSSVEGLFSIFKQTRSNFVSLSFLKYKKNLIRIYS